MDQNIQTLLTNLKAVSIADLQNAEDIAVANNDTLMAPCYPALIQFVQSFAGPSGTVSGAFSAFETVRVTRMGMQGGLPDYLKLGCAAGVIDEAMFITRLGAMLGLATSLGPVAPIVVPPATAKPEGGAPSAEPPVRAVGASAPPAPAGPAAPKIVPPSKVPQAPTKSKSAEDPAATARLEMAKTDLLLKIAAMQQQPHLASTE